MSKVLENVGMGAACDIIFQEFSVGGISMMMLLSHSIMLQAPMKLPINCTEIQRDSARSRLCPY